MNDYYYNERILATYLHNNNSSAMPNVEWQKCDVTSVSDLAALAEKCAGEKLTVFYFAASHNIDYVFEEQEKAENVNIKALETFYKIMPKIDKLFFSSSDCVYGENIGDSKFTENSPLNPVNIYGIQKMKAEKTVIQNGHCVVRLPFMYGPSLSDKKGFYDNVFETLKHGETVEMIDGFVRNALSFDETAEILLKLSLLEKDKIPTVLNVCSDREYKKYDIGLKIANEAFADTGLLLKISESDSHKFFRDKRASRSSMDNSLVKKILSLEKIG